MTARELLGIRLQMLRKVHGITLKPLLQSYLLHLSISVLWSMVNPVCPWIFIFLYMLSIIWIRVDFEQCSNGTQNRKTLYGNYRIWEAVMRKSFTYEGKRYFIRCKDEADFVQQIRQKNIQLYMNRLSGFSQVTLNKNLQILKAFLKLQKIMIYCLKTR